MKLKFGIIFLILFLNNLNLFSQSIPNNKLIKPEYLKKGDTVAIVAPSGVLKNYKGYYSSEGPISITTKERVKEKGKINKELKSKHNIIRKINSKYTIYCSPGHFVGFNSKLKKESKLEKYLFNHQIKKKFQFSLEWEVNQLAIWDNRSMLHQATPFKGNRIMHRITIQ